MYVSRHKYLIAGLVGSALWVVSAAWGEAAEVKAIIWMAIGSLAGSAGHFLDTVFCKDGLLIVPSRKEESDAEHWVCDARWSAKTACSLRSGPWRFPAGHAPVFWPRDGQSPRDH